MYKKKLCIRKIEIPVFELSDTFKMLLDEVDIYPRKNFRELLYRNGLTLSSTLEEAYFVDNPTKALEAFLSGELNPFSFHYFGVEHPEGYYVLWYKERDDKYYYPEPVFQAKKE